MAAASNKSDCAPRWFFYCVRADLIGGETLEQIGLRAGCTRQSVEHLVADFCHAIGWK